MSSGHPLFSETRLPKAKVNLTTCLICALAPPSRWNKPKSSNPAFVQNRKQVGASRSVEDHDPQLELGRVPFLRPTGSPPEPGQHLNGEGFIPPSTPCREQRMRHAHLPQQPAAARHSFEISSVCSPRMQMPRSTLQKSLCFTP